MNAEFQDLVLKHLLDFRDDLADFAQKLDANTACIFRLADRFISLRTEVTSLKKEVQTLALVVSGHAARFANVGSIAESVPNPTLSGIKEG